MRSTRTLGVASALMTAALLGTGATAQEPRTQAKKKAAAPRVPPGVKVERNLDYVGNGLARQKLDLYVPEQAKGPLPLVVWVHGGGWRSGSKDSCRAAFLSGRGFAVASLNYRLVDAGPFPAQIEDCRAAIRWLRASAKRYRIDPDHIGVWGGSAGGHLVALLGTAGDETGWDVVGGNTGVSARVQAVCDFFGPADLLIMLEGNRVLPADGPLSRLLGGDPREKREVARKASPVSFVSSDDPPFLIVHGDHDQVVPLEQSMILHKKLEDAGVKTTLLVVKNGRHGNWGPDAEPDAAAVNEKVFDFFETQLKRGKGNPAGTAGTP